MRRTLAAGLLGLALTGVASGENIIGSYLNAPSTKVGNVGDFRNQGSFFNSRIREIISDDEMLCTLGQPLKGYFIMRKVSTVGLADGEIINFKSVYKCVATKRYNGRTYFVLEPHK